MKVIDFFAMNKIGCPMKGKVKRSNSILVCVRLRIHRYVSPPYIHSLIKNLLIRIFYIRSAKKVCNLHAFDPSILRHGEI